MNGNKVKEKVKDVFRSDYSKWQAKLCYGQATLNSEGKLTQRKLLSPHFHSPPQLERKNQRELLLNYLEM